MTHSYTTRWFFCTHFTHLLLVVRQIMQSIHWIPRERAASKISEWKICAYTGMSEKVGPFIYQSRKIGSVIYFLSKKGANHIPGSAEKGVGGGGLFGTHIRTMPYIGSYPHTLPPPAPTPSRASPFVTALRAFMSAGGSNRKYALDFKLSWRKTKPVHKTWYLCSAPGRVWSLL